MGCAEPTSVKREKTSRTRPTEIAPNPTRDSMVEVSSVEPKELSKEFAVDPDVTRLQSWLDGRRRSRPERMKSALRTTSRLNLIPF